MPIAYLLQIYFEKMEDVHSASEGMMAAPSDSSSGSSAEEGSFASDQHHLDTDNMLPESPQPPQSSLDVLPPADKLERYAEVKMKLDRARMPVAMTAGMCLVFIVLDAGKQVCTYAVTYYNAGRYPLPQTSMVAVIELVKFLVMFGLMFRRNLWSTFKVSLTFSVPSVIYAVNNNIYFYALHFVAPPVWLILIQSRVIMTALVYRLLFKRLITGLQWFALLLLICGIAITQLEHLTKGAESSPSKGGGVNRSSANVTSVRGAAAETTASTSPIFAAFFLSLLSASLSVSASVYTEFLFKNNKRPFVEQQMQLYMFSFLVSLIFVFVGEIRYRQLQNVPAISWFILTLLVCALLLGSAGGLAVAGIVKMLDNIVKIYLGAVANMVTALFSSLLFPSKFHLSAEFAVALLIMFLAIYLYETKSLAWLDLIEDKVSSWGRATASGPGSVGRAMASATAHKKAVAVAAAAGGVLTLIVLYGLNPRLLSSSGDHLSAAETN